MASKKQKNEYDADLAAAKKLIQDQDIPAEGEYSLEDILDEYGESLEQKLMADVDAKVEQEFPTKPKTPEPDAAEERPAEPHLRIGEKIAAMLSSLRAELRAERDEVETESPREEAEDETSNATDSGQDVDDAPAEGEAESSAPQAHGKATAKPEVAPSSADEVSDEAEPFAGAIADRAQGTQKDADALGTENAALENETDVLNDGALEDNDDALTDEIDALVNDDVALENETDILNGDTLADNAALADETDALKNDGTAQGTDALENETDVLDDTALEDDDTALEDDDDALADDDDALEDSEDELAAAMDELPPPPRPIPMEEVVSRTVDSVLEDEQADRPRERPLRRRRGLFSRKRMVDTEALYQQPEEEETQAPPKDLGYQPSAPIEPEIPLVDAAEASRSIVDKLAKPLPVAALLTALLAVWVTVWEQGVTIPLWSSSTLLQTVVLLGILAAVSSLCRSVFVRGLDALRHRRFTGELLISIAVVVTALDCLTRVILPGRSLSPPYVVVVCAAMVMALWGGAWEGSGLFDTFRTAAMTDRPPYLVTETADGACKQAGHVEGFYTGVAAQTLSARWQAALLPVILVASVIFAGLASLGQGRGQDFFLCWSAILSGGASFALSISWGRPFSSLARQLQKSGCAVAGWSGAEAISRKRSVILTDMDLFPPGALHLNGIKLFGEEMGKAVSYAASLVKASDSGLIRLFDGLLRSENGKLQELDDFSFYEEGGYSANIHGESVLLGTASFMRKMEVRLPGNLNLRTGLYLSVDRQLIAVFAVKYQASENVDWALRLLKRNHIRPILASRDPNITPALLKRKFNRGVRVEYPPLASRLALSEAENGQEGMPRALLLREGLMPYAETVVGCRRLCRGVRQCTVLALFGSAAGTLLAFYLCFLGNFSLLTPMMVLLFQTLWIIPVLLLAGWTGQF